MIIIPIDLVDFPKYQVCNYLSLDGYYGSSLVDIKTFSSFDKAFNLAQKIIKNNIDKSIEYILIYDYYDSDNNIISPPILMFKGKIEEEKVIPLYQWERKD